MKTQNHKAIFKSVFAIVASSVMVVAPMAFAHGHGGFSGGGSSMMRQSVSRPMYVQKSVNNNSILHLANQGTAVNSAMLNQKVKLGSNVYSTPTTTQLNQKLKLPSNVFTTPTSNSSQLGSSLNQKLKVPAGTVTPPTGVASSNLNQKLKLPPGVFNPPNSAGNNPGTGGTGSGSGGTGTGGTGTGGSGTGGTGSGGSGTGTGGSGTGSGGMGSGSGSGMGSGSGSCNPSCPPYYSGGGFGFPWFVPVGGFGGGFGGYGGGSYTNVVTDSAPPVASDAPLAPAATAPVTATAQPIDLELIDVRQIDAGDATQGPAYRVTVRNNSAVDVAQPFDVALVASLGRQPAADSASASTRMNGIAAGQTATVDVRLPATATSLGRNVMGQPVAFSWLTVVVDPRQEVQEVTKANNFTSIGRLDIAMLAAN